MIGKTKKLKLNFTFRKNELKELLNNKNILKKKKKAGKNILDEKKV